jgi:hypothetical protein
LAAKEPQRQTGPGVNSASGFHAKAKIPPLDSELASPDRLE